MNVWRCAACVAVPAGLCSAAVIEYQPGLGTLPSAQGWVYAGGGAEAGSVSGSVLSYGPTSTAGAVYWQHNPVGVVDFSTSTWAIESRVRLTNTTYGNVSGFRRGGFVLYLGDSAGNGISADLGSSAISLRNDNNGLSDPEMAFDLASAFHVVRLEAGPAGARLLVDGIELLTSPLGGFGGAPVGYWGEASILASTGLTEVGYTVLVPAPGVGGICGLWIMLVGGRRRRR